MQFKDYIIEENEESFTFEVPINEKWHTKGDGLWSKTKKEVLVLRMGIEVDTKPDEFDKEFISHDFYVMYDTKSWDDRKLGLIYTDSGFIKDLHVKLASVLKSMGLDQDRVSSVVKDVEYSEQGMQSFGRVSLDAYDLTSFFRELYAKSAYSEIIKLNKIHPEQLKCKVCIKMFDKYDEPRLLPCDATICSECDAKFDKEFKCPIESCKKNHLKPKEGFPLNEIIMQIVSSSHEEDEKFEKLESHFNKIESYFSENDVDSADCRIFEFCTEIKTQIQLITEERIQQINEMNESLIKQVDTYRNEFLEDFKKIKKKSNNSLMHKEIKAFLDEKRKYLKCLKNVQNEKAIINFIDDVAFTKLNENDKLNELIDKAIIYISKLDDEKTKHENSIFDKKKLEFEVNKKKLDDNFLGTIKSKSKTTVVIETSDEEEETSDHKSLQRYFNMIPELMEAYLDSDEERFFGYDSDDSDDSDDDDDDDDVVYTITGHPRPVRGLTVLNNGRLVSCSDDRTIKIWDQDNGDFIRVLNNHNGSVNCVSVLNSGHIISGSNDRLKKIWDGNTGRLVFTIYGNSNPVRCLATTKDGLLVSSDSNKLLILNPNNGRCSNYINLCCEIHSIVILNNGLIATSCDTDCGTINILDNKLRLIDQLKRHTRRVNQLVVLNNGCLASCSDDETIKIWDTTGWRLIRSIRRNSQPVKCLAVLKNGYLASSDGCVINIWDPTNGRFIKSFDGHSKDINGFVVLKNGNLASCSNDKSIIVWNTASL